MKHIIYILTFTLIFVSCKKEEQSIDGFLIEGKIDKPQNSAIVKLFRLENKKIIPIDSSVALTDTFTLNGKIDHPDMYYLTIEGINGSVPILLENEKITIDVYVDSLYASKMTGGKETEYYMMYQDYVAGLRGRNKALTEQFREASQTNDTATISRLRKEQQGLYTENDAFELEFLNTYKDAALSALILERNLNAKKFTFQQIKNWYEGFSDDIKETRSAKAIADYISTNAKTAIGEKAPEFSGPTPDGETIALNDILGKVTIIDFWAAWCGPCRRENPNVVKVYEKYHDKGLEIIGVSLDGNPRQKVAKTEWTKAIETDNLNWYHVSNLQYFNDPIARAYNINSIPATFILDADGKIIAKDLRGTALEEKIAELLD